MHQLTWLPAAAILVLAIAGLPEGQQGERAVTTNPFRTFGIVANNAFFYYADVERAARFYTQTLGIRMVADYGYAKILRVSESSYLTLVDAAKGMHAADEPKTTAIALITDQLDEWYRLISSRGVPLRGTYQPIAGRPHDGFVAVDPEGYFLEFERFNAHQENVKLTPVLTALPHLPASPVPPPDGSGSSGLGVKATVLWLYYRDLAAAERFYEDRLGFDLIVDQGWAKLYRTSSSGFIGLVDESRGMHRATEKKGVTVSFFTDEIERWFAHVKGQQTFALRSDAVHQDPEKRYRAFVGYDPEGYFLEFDLFLPHPQNPALLAALRR